MSLANTIIYGELEQVKATVTVDTDLDDYDEYGYTPLIEAAIVNKVDIAEFLLNKEANPDFPDTTSRTALHWAVDNNNLKLAQLLLEHGADANAYTSYGQCITVLPLLRGQKAMLDLLEQYKADINFAKDFIHSKSLAHRFSLNSKTDIINARGQFVEVNLEGFMIQATIAIIAESLRYFSYHYAARDIRPLLPLIDPILTAFDDAAELLRYQHYTVNRDQHRPRIAELLEKHYLFLPIAYTGHAISLVKYGQLIALCDRGAMGKKHGSLRIYKMRKTDAFNQQLLEKLFFQRTTEKFVHKGLIKVLNLKPMLTINLPLQITGNCSWANIEGVIPTFIFLGLIETTHKTLERAEEQALQFFESWQQFDKNRTIDDMLDAFQLANPARKAAIASLLALVLFQTCDHQQKDDYELAQKIATVFEDSRYHYILKSYLTIHHERYHNESGKNFNELLELLGVNLS